MTDYLGVILGGFIAIIGMIINELFRVHREKIGRSEELEQRRVEAAHEYFRSLYNAVKPFLRAYSMLIFRVRIVRSEIAQNIGLPTSDVEILKVDFGEVIQDLISATQSLIYEGYAALFPEELFNSILKFNLQLEEFNSLPKTKAFHELGKEVRPKLVELLDTGRDVKDKIRHLLNVDALEL